MTLIPGKVFYRLLVSASFIFPIKFSHVHSRLSDKMLIDGVVKMDVSIKFMQEPHCSLNSE